MSQVPASLVRHFEAPEGFTGQFGWLCGFSADEGFLNEALERFTYQQANQRAYAGQTLLALMLDPRAVQIDPIGVPGLLHLPWANGKLPFNLMHAKVALLAFRSTDTSGAWCLRLLVSTGNWTRQTLEQSLDLVWCLDLHSDDLSSPSEATRQVCADISSAWGLLGWLRSRYDGRALQANSDTKDVVEQLDKCLLKQVKPCAANLTPRFFDNRNKSLLDQLPAKVLHASGRGSARNYLAMVSGFYESSLADEQSSVPLSIVRRLRGEEGEPRLLTASSSVDLFVNVASCQGIADAVPGLTAAGIGVKPAVQPAWFAEQPQRTLHAKFIFSASEVGDSGKTASPWLYLGSGNLTRQGFTLQMGPGRSKGNLEAGVVFVPEPMNWYPAKPGFADPQAIGYRLPIQWDQECVPENLRQGQDLEVGDEVFAAAPVAYLVWRDAETPDHGWLSADALAQPACSLLDTSEQACAWVEGQGFVWSGPRPRQVRVAWQDAGATRTAVVPVLDGFGRLAATGLPDISLEDAWLQLDGFPHTPGEDELPNAFNPSQDLPDRQGSRASAGEAARYPIRQMMELIESIAAKQTALEPRDWPLWCARLEQSLSQAAGCELLQQFLALELNPLHALRQPAFRPGFAETADGPEGQRYETALSTIEAHWKLGSAFPLGTAI
ncbi:phospholipase D-like domain-containing protein [Pseudomonas protegens]|uniref:hypothetical protein n=1 Tax=Pseudomonas protegens TaxID=380021 RepID=UPI0021893AF2|nr:MAG: hypothetical protein NAG77_12825 [Pseudomonas protegens]WEK23823.1 MAG: hypothetical protein P0Y61_26680 [Pseudomonas protegens]